MDWAPRVQSPQACLQDLRRHDEALQLPLGIRASVNGGATSYLHNGECDPLTDSAGFAELSPR